MSQRTTSVQANPNLFELRGGGLHVTFTASAIDGKNHLSYRDADGPKEFSGRQIATTRTPLGALHTVELRQVADLEQVTFTLLLPEFRGGGSDVVRTVGVTTVRHTTIAGPPAGQVTTYDTVTLTGTARTVQTIGVPAPSPRTT